MKQINKDKLLALVATSLMGLSTAWAHGDEDHSQDAKPAIAAASGAATGTVAGQTTASQRLPDGGLFVPKTAQRQLGIRTVLAEVKDQSATVELNGHVIADPNASGRVQASQPGRVESGPKGLPTLGQKVIKGQVLLWLRPTVGSVERGNQRAALADIDAQLAIAERKVARYAQLEGSIPQKEIDSSKFELGALKQRRAALGAGLSEAESLTAPVSGVISATHVVNGQVVEARDVLFEIVDPARLAVEALAYDPALIEGIASASASLAGQAIDLQYVGGGKQLREQALPLLFRVKTQNASVAVGQSVKVIAKTSHLVKGVAIPAAALARNSAGETVVWIHIGAERFVQRRVNAQPLDASLVAVTTGITSGDRVVSQGANLLAQVR